MTIEISTTQEIKNILGTEAFKFEYYFQNRIMVCFVNIPCINSMFLYLETNICNEKRNTAEINFQQQLR